MQGRVLEGRYRLISPLGQGGMGAVWRAQQLDLPRPVAIKVIHPGEAGAAQNRVRFEREARAAAELTSFHIVDITDYGVDNDTPHIVMKLLEGESLAARLIRRGKLPFDGAVCLLSQVAKALTLAHEKRIVHRDLKPENVFIEGYQPGKQGTPGNPEVVKVLDFEIAKVLNAESLGGSVGTCTEAPIGTPYYMSPEQIVDSERDRDEGSYSDARWTLDAMLVEQCCIRVGIGMLATGPQTKVTRRTVRHDCNSGGWWLGRHRRACDHECPDD